MLGGRALSSEMSVSYRPRHGGLQALPHRKTAATTGPLSAAAMGAESVATVTATVTTAATTATIVPT